MTDKKTVMQVNATGHWKELFPKKNMLLGSHNLNDNEILIAHIDRVEIGEYKNQVGETENSPIIHFKNVPPMILNSGNARTIEKLYGWKYKDWSGKSIYINRAVNKYHIGGTHRLVVSAEVPVLEKPAFDASNQKQLDRAIEVYRKDGNFDAIEKHMTLSEDDKLTIEAKSKEAA